MEPIERQIRRASPGFFEQLTPKTAFVFGIVSATAVLSIIALAILIPTVAKGKAGKVAGAAVNAAANTNTADTAAVGKFRPVDPKVDHIRGNTKAKVVLIEYSDLECPFCKKHQTTMQQIMKDYGDKIEWVYRHFPLESLHSQAKKEAGSAECASEQGKFWEYIDKIYEVTPSNDGLDLAKLPEYAKAAGVKDIKKFNDCVAKDKYASVVTDDLNDATSAGAQGTPHTILIDSKGKAQAISGALPYAQFKAAIDAAL